MPARLVALDEGADIPLDRTMVVVGRHPQCDARLDSLRVSRHHCCMTHDNGDVVVRDLGSTNGIRINGQRVDVGRLRPGDELCIAHIRYRLDSGQGHDATMAGDVNGHSAARLAVAAAFSAHSPAHSVNGSAQEVRASVGHPAFDNQSLEKPLAAMMREILPANIADRCKIQIIVQVQDEDHAKPNEEH